MAEEKKILKGLYQVTESTFNGIPENDRIGCLWFIRNADTDIRKVYFGKKQYGEFNPKGGSEEVEKLKKIIGSGFTDGNLTEKIVELENKEDLYIEKVLYIADESTRQKEDPEGTEELPYLLFIYSDESRLRSHIVVSETAIKIAPAEKESVVDESTGKNFLTTNTSNEYEVNGVDADAAVLQEDITVTETVGAVGAGVTFNSGTSVYDVLMQILCKEKWATPSTGKTFSVTIANPSITKTASGVVEVGTKVNFSSNIGAETATQNITAGTFTYGYADDNAGTNYSSNKTFTKSFKPTEKDSSYNSMKMTFSGFKETTPMNGQNSVSFSGAVVSEGTNTVTVNETGVTYVSDTTEFSKTFYVATNLKHYYKEDKETDNTLDLSNPYTGETITPTGKSTSSITGKYKYYFGYLPLGTVIDNVTSDMLSALTTTGFTELTGETTLISADTLSDGVVAVLIQEGYSIGSLIEKLSGNDLKDDMKSKAFTIEIGGGNTANYNIFILEAAANNTYSKITIKK